MRTSSKIIGTLIASLAMVVLPAATAHAEPFAMSIDNAILDMGGINGVRAIDSELEPPDPPATLSGDLTDGTVNVSKTGFVFPTKSAEVSPGINANIDMEANEDITGTFDAGTGNLELDVNLKATVAVLGSNCVISPIQLQLSTDSARPYIGEEFADGIDGTGAISASWTSLPPVTGGGTCGVVAGLIAGPGGIAMSHGVHEFETCETDPLNPRCDVVLAPEKEPMLNSAPPSSTDQTTAAFTFAKGNGETQPVEGFECSLDGGAAEPCNSGNKEYTDLSVGSHSFAVKATNSAGSGPAASYSWTITEAPKCPEGTAGTPPDCEKLECPPGMTGTPPDCKKPDGQAKLGGLKIKPKNKKVRRGKKAVFRVRVKNVGNAIAKGVKVCVKAPKRRVRVRKCVNVGRIAAGKAKTAKFKVKAKRRRGKAVLKFRARSRNAGKKAGRAKVRIR